MIIENDRKIVDPSQNFSWDCYLKKVNNTDSFKTRYYHYLRWRIVLQYINFILENVKTNPKIALDIGCNRGYYAVKLGELGLKVDAVDLNLDLYRLIPNTNVIYFEGNFLNWVPPRMYDLIMVFEVYEHITPNEREKFLQKIVNVLNPGGILIFGGPNCFSLYYGAGYFKNGIRKIFGYIKEIDWHYRIPCFYYNHIFACQKLNIINWDTNGVIPIFSNKLEGLFKGSKIQSILKFDLFLSKIFKGFGANYFAILKKGEEF